MGVLALSLCAAEGCFKEDFMLGAMCGNDVQCGEDQCCSGWRCRPAPDYCDRGAGIDTSYEYAYSACRHDDECREYGMPHCVWLAGANAGFCADLCLGVPGNCEKHPDSEDRTCISVDGQDHCALRCCSDSDPNCVEPCPETMECLDDVCVPKT